VTFAMNARPIASAWPVLEVDTNTAVDIEALLGRITAANSTWSGNHGS
jgi:hypothetical protein